MKKSLFNRSSNFHPTFGALSIILICSSIFLLFSCNSLSTKDNEPIIKGYSGGEVKLDSQIWMNQNLNVNVFRNGDPIPQIKTDKEWKKAIENKQPAWCYYDNDPKNGVTYGKLYNWYALNDKRGLAPAGWHIPKDSEWTKLENFLGKEAGKQMKTKSGWNDYQIDNKCSNCKDWNQEYRSKVSCHECKDQRMARSKKTVSGNGTNSSGFSGLPGGFRFSNGNFNNIGYYGYWWCAPENNTTLSYYRDLYHYDVRLLRSSNLNEGGMSVRCVRD